MMYEDYFRLRFPPIKHNRKGKDIHNETFNNIPNCIKDHLHVNCLQDGFVIYNDKVLVHKQYVITTIIDYMIPMDFC